MGRIAAVVNRTHNLYYKDTTGFFGFFDCIDDSEVANELFRTASKVLSEKGLSTIRGPYSPSVNDECGLLVDGFSSPPMVMMPFNPEYYEKLLTGQGLNRVRDLFAFYMSAETTAPEKIIRIAERVKKGDWSQCSAFESKKTRSRSKDYSEALQSDVRSQLGFCADHF